MARRQNQSGRTHKNIQRPVRLRALAPAPNPEGSLSRYLNGN